jgi:hypothetical protein
MRHDGFTGADIDLKLAIGHGLELRHPVFVQIVQRETTRGVRRLNFDDGLCVCHAREGDGGGGDSADDEAMHNSLPTFFDHVRSCLAYAQVD